MLLYRYILQQILVWTAVNTAALIGIVWLSQTIGLIKLLVNRGAGFADFVLLSILTIPLWLTVILPVALLIATMLTLNKLQQDREITTLSSVGMSTARIMRAPLSAGLLVTALLYVNSVFILPLGYSGYKTLQSDLRRSAPIVVLQEGVFTDITEGLTVFIEEKAGRYDFRDIFVHDRRDPGKLVEIIAGHGSLDLDGETPQLVFFRGVRSEFSPGQNQATLLNFDRYSIGIAYAGKPESARARDYNELGILTLLRGESGSEKYSREMRAEGHFRIAGPLLGLAMAMIGAVAILSRRYSRVASWRLMVAGAVFASLILIAIIIARGLTTRTPALYPLQYAVCIIPLVLGFIAVHEPRRRLRAARAYMRGEARS